MILTESAVIRLKREFVEVYGLGNVLVALAKIAARQADDLSNTEPSEADEIACWRNAAAVIPTYIERI